MAKTNNKDVHRGVVLYLDGKEIPNNAKAIRAEMKKVRESIDNMTRGSEEYVRATKKYRELDGILQHHRQQLKAVEMQQTSLLQRGIKLFKDYSLQITGAITAITGVAMELNKFRKQAAEKEDAQANLQALTGLSDENIQWLTAQAETLSTTMEKSGLRVRKSATEILEAYMLVGSKKPELLQDKEALNAVTIEAMRLAEAAKMELKDAVAGLTLAMNQYGASADEASRYVNVLAAGSKYGAVGVATQTETIVKAGVAASTAKVPIEQLVGVLETLGEKGIEGSIAGTQLKTTLLKMEAGAEETRPSVVGLQTALERLAAKNLDVTEMTKMFGQESFTTAQALISSADKVKYYTDAVTDTNVATEQAAINSDTTAARMAQVRNQINLTGQELAKTLSPILNKTVGWTRKFVMMLPGMIEWIRKWGLEVLVLVAAYATYTYGVRTANAVTKAWHATMLFFTTGIAKMRSAVELTTLAINFNRAAMVRMGLQMRSMNALSKLFVAGQALVRAALLAVTGHTTQAARAMGVFQLVMKSVNPWAVAATAIAAVGTALYVYYNRTRDAIHVNKQLQQAQDDAADRYEEQRAHIEYLNKTVHDQTLGYQRRNTALEELKRLMPDYKASLTKEGELINDNTTAIDNYLDRLKKKIALQALQEQYVETLKEQNRAQRKVDNEESKAAKAYNTRRDIQEGKGSQPLNPLQRGAKWLWNAVTEQYYDYRKSVAKQELEDAKKDGEEIQKMIDDVTHQLDQALRKVEASDESNNSSGGTGDAETETERQKRIREAIEAVNTEYDGRANELKRKFIKGEIETEEEYGQQLEALEMERLNRQLEIAGLEPKQREQIEGKVLDMKMKLMQQLKGLDDMELDEEQAKLQKMLRQNKDAYNRRNAIIAKAVAAGILTEEEAAQRQKANEAKHRDDDRKAQEQAATQRLSISRKGLDAALLELRKARAEEGMTEKEYNAAIINAQRAFYEKALEDQQLSKEDRERIERQLAETKLQITESSNKEIEERNKQLFDSMKSAGEELGEALAEWLTDSESSFKDFSKSILKIVLDTIEKMMIAEIAKVTMASIATSIIDWSAIARGAAKIAAITAAFETAKGAISNFYTGGYTGQGRWDEPRGVVHAGEFVANRYAVANDAVRPVLDLIDQAQRSGSIANLTAADIAAVATPARPSAAPSPATVPSASSAGHPTRDPELTAAIRLLTRTTARAAEAYQEPSPSFCYLEGRGGINTAQELLSTIKKNASRK